MDSVQNSGPFILSSLLADVPLSGDGDHGNIHITCVEFWNGNLYIGTSASEVLHYVRIPSESDEQPIFVPGTRLEPALPDAHLTARKATGVQQILVLPEDGKACVLCDGFLSFYSLPELSPAFESTKPISCTWVGGVDQNHAEQDASEDGIQVMLCLKSRIRIVKIGDGPRKIRDIVIEGCKTAVRRDSIACIADAQSYSLLDLVEQQQIPLSPLSTAVERPLKLEENPRTSSHSASSSVSHPGRRSPNTLSPERGHSKSASLGNIISTPESAQPQRDSARSTQGQLSPSIASDQPMSTGSNASHPLSVNGRTSPLGPQSDSDKATKGVAHESGSTPASQLSQFRPAAALKPHIASPNSNEFLFITGSSYDAPGVGMFVNLDGEPSRGTLEFERYPEAITIDGKGIDPSSTPMPGEPAEDGYVLAAMKKASGSGHVKGLEIQRWDLDSGEGGGSKEWLEIVPRINSEAVFNIPIGLRSALSSNEIFLPELTRNLGLKQLNLNLETHGLHIANTDNIAEAKTRREKSEAEYIRRLSLINTRTIGWHSDRIWCTVRNPLVIRLDAMLPKDAITAWQGALRVKNLRSIEHVLNSIRGQVPQTELDIVGLAYIRQKSSLLLFMDTLKRSTSGGTLSDIEERLTGQALAEGDIDPRILLILLPILCDEVLPGSSGIWLPAGLKELVEQFLQSHKTSTSERNIGLTHPHLIKNYLVMWRKKKGFGSVTSVPEVFRTVDAALLRLLLIMDNPRNPQRTELARSDLYSLAEEGVECFDHAIKLLEEFQRLYVLSILYQSRTMSGHVLATWRRILEGEHDEGEDFINGEHKMRKYLLKIKDARLVEEYGTWLANRNPELGVRVFADDTSKVKFEPKQAVEILRKHAPGAVKEYLEHLVFGKNLAQYANDLIGYYLSSVLTALETPSTNARSALLLSYESYRALKAPKPTYSQFVTENALDTDWWRNRLRLLQLLGGSHGAASQYDVTGIFSQLEPYEIELIPEMIVLNGRQGRHREAIRLLTHGLGDFDTAVSYCLLGGGNIYSPIANSQLPKDAITPREDQMTLFEYLLEEFFCIEDSSDRIVQTSELLGRFSGWFDVSQVLNLVPDEWSVELVSTFLENAFRRLVSERQETTIARALTGVENLAANIGLIEKIDALGPRLDGGHEVEGIG